MLYVAEILLIGEPTGLLLLSVTFGQGQGQQVVLYVAAIRHRLAAMRLV